MTDAATERMHGAVLSFMRRNRAEGAMWTSDIAAGAKVQTGCARAVLKALEKNGVVRRVVTGNPTSWELVEQKEDAQ